MRVSSSPPAAWVSCARGLAGGESSRDPAAASLAALASVQVHLARDDLAAARILLADVDGHSADFCLLPGEPSLSVVAGLIRARIALADCHATGARGRGVRMRDTSPARDLQLDGVLTGLDCDIAV